MASTLCSWPGGGRRGSVAILPAAAMLFFWLVQAAFAQSLVLDNLVLDNREGAIVVRFAVVVEDTRPIREMLLEGQSLRLTCEARLYRQRTLWPDKTVAKARTRIVLDYNVLEEAFRARNMDGAVLGQDQDLDRLLGTLLDKVVLDLGSWNELTRNRHYVLDLTIDLDRDDVPSWLKKTLFFWGWEAAPKAEYQLDFDY